MDNDLAKRIVEEYCESIIGSDAVIVRDPRGLYTQIKNALCASTTEQVIRLREALEEVERLKQHVADLNHDFNAALKHCDDHHIEGLEL